MRASKRLERMRTPEPQRSIRPGSRGARTQLTSGPGPSRADVFDRSLRHATDRRAAEGGERGEGERKRVDPAGRIDLQLLEVQMRLGAEAGVADLGQHRAGIDLLTDHHLAA